MKLIARIAVLVTALCATAHGAVYTYTVNSAIPDNSIIGLTDSHTISGLGPQITDITVTLNISGGYNGDLYGYLRLNDSPMVVLVNRVGVTGSNPDGYGNTGFLVTLTGSLSAQDIHYYQDHSPSYNGSGQLTGTWQADGRTSPTDTTRGSLNSFNGYDPNGTWTLFFADLSAGDQSSLVSWSLNIETVPEPLNAALFLFTVLLFVTGLVRYCRQRRLLRHTA